MTPYLFQRGETVTIALDVTAGDAASVTAISAAMKPLAPGRSGIDAEAAQIALGVAANGTSGWTLTLSAAACGTLATGTYLLDARLAVGSGIVITDPVTLRIAEAVTSA